MVATLTYQNQIGAIMAKYILEAHKTLELFLQMQPYVNQSPTDLVKIAESYGNYVQCLDWFQIYRWKIQELKKNTITLTWWDLKKFRLLD